MSIGDNNVSNNNQIIEENTKETASTTSFDTKVCKKRANKEKSKAWNHFTRAKDAYGKLQKILCNYCKSKFSVLTATSSLKKHFTICSKYKVDKKQKH